MHPRRPPSDDRRPRGPVLFALALLLAASSALPLPGAAGPPAATPPRSLAYAGLLPAAPAPPPFLPRGPADLPAGLAGMNDVEPAFAASNASLDAQALELERAGVTWVRTEMVQQGGSVRSATYDYWLKVSAPAHHLRVLALLDYATIPDAITHLNAPLTGAGQFNPYILDFCAEATALATRYGHDVGAWEVYNEENSNYWMWSASNGTMGQVWPAQYGKLLTQTYLDLHAQVPSTTVLVGGLLPPGSDATSSDPSNNQSVGAYLNATYASGAFAWYRANYAGQDPVDGVGLHPYVDPGMQLTPLLDHVRATLDLLQPGVPYWMTEFGWTASASAGYGSAGEVAQAGNLTTAYRLFSARSDVSVACWFAWADFPGGAWGLGGMASNGSLTYVKSSWNAFYDLFHHDGASITALVAPASVTVGGMFEVNATVLNTGSSTWSEAGLPLGLPGLLRLGTAPANGPLLLNGSCGGYANAPADARIFTCGAVPPGATAYYNATFRAPASPGTATLALQMVHDGVAWFGSVARWNLSVVAPTPLYAVGGTVDNATGAPVAGARVNVSGPAGGSSVLTDGTGSFTFDLPNGSYTLSAAYPGDRSVQRALLVAGAALVVNLTLVPMSGNGTLRVYVLARAGGPVAWSRLEVEGSGLYTPLSNGTVDLTLPSGRWALDAFAIGFVSAHANVTVSPGNLSAYVATLDPLPQGALFPVGFQVTNRSTGAAVAGARVVLADLVIGSTSASGSLVAPQRWPNGTYAATFVAAGYRVNTSSVVVLGSTTWPVELTANATGPPPTGTCAGSYFPSSAILTVDQATVGGGAIPGGGVGFSVTLAPGTHYYRLVDAQGASTGHFSIVAGATTWVHLAAPNASSGPAPSSGTIGSVLLLAVPALAVAAVVLLLVVRRRRGLPRRRAAAPGPEEARPPLDTTEGPGALGSTEGPEEAGGPEPQRRDGPG